MELPRICSLLDVQDKLKHLEAGIKAAPHRGGVKQVEATWGWCWRWSIEET